MTIKLATGLSVLAGKKYEIEPKANAMLVEFREPI
jgi:hypothetical protein